MQGKGDSRLRRGESIDEVDRERMDRDRSCEESEVPVLVEKLEQLRLEVEAEAELKLGLPIPKGL